MKKNAFILATIVIISSACSGIKVTTDLDKTANFTKYQTVSFLGWQEDIDQVLNQLNRDRLRDAVKDEMWKRKLKLVDDNGDLVISLYLVVDQKTSITAYSSYYGGGGRGRYGYRRGGWGWGHGNSTTTYSESDYLQGTLVVDAFDQTSGDLVWQGVGTGVVSQKPQKREKNMPKVVAKILKDFPLAPVN